MLEKSWDQDRRMLLKMWRKGGLKFKECHQAKNNNNYQFVMKSKTVMMRAKRGRLQPIREMYVKIFWSVEKKDSVPFVSEPETGTCGENTLSFYFAAFPLTVV